MQLLFQLRKERLDRVATRMPDDISDEQDLQLGGAHHQILVEKKKGALVGLPFCLFCVFNSPGLAHHGDANLTGKAELRFDSLGDVPRHQLSSAVVDLLGLDQDPDLAASLDGVRLLDSLERIGDLLELLEPLDVRLE